MANYINLLINGYHQSRNTYQTVTFINQITVSPYSQSPPNSYDFP